ncbi:membrane protein [Caballeronia calidae]|uniref:Membrane protein n=1 Tax=Caballeronia calidae TaxID=1777139 RepID=A0A158EJ22_9BURK|nr:MFS transporter [Caballeronia calidae]SAL06858.1 membrane protein [Caballeronia calidae]
MSGSGSKRTLGAAAIGNFGEQYDFAVFGFAMPVIAAQFFPKGDAVAALLSTFAIFAVGFLARPMGGLVFGYLSDRLGRVKVLTLTIWLMAAGTGTIGLLPTYDAIGLAAPVLLVLCRLTQGAAFGGEFTGSTTFVLESAPDDRRARWVGINHCIGNVPIAGVALTLFAFQYAVGKENYLAWGWRIPFLLGSLIGVVGYLIRRSVDDPEEFKQATRGRTATNPLRAAARGGLKPMLHVALVMPIQAVAAYLLIGYMYTYMVREAHLDAGTALLANGAGIGIYAILCPIGGALSDRYGRKPVMSVGALWIALVAYLSLHLASGGSPYGAFAGQILLGIGIGIYAGPATATTVELFPTSFRATGHAIAYQVTVAILGGTTPLICGWLVSVLHSPMAPAWYVTGFAILNVLIVQFVPETKGIRLRTSVVDANPLSMNLASDTPRTSAGEAR